MKQNSRFTVLFGGFTRRKKRLEHAHLLYGAVVANARDPRLFRRFDMPDTFDGRFEMLAAHLYLLNRRLQGEGGGGAALSQEVFDLFVADMDAALREAAVGDQTVPKRLAKMTRVVHGRAAAYDRALGLETERKTALAEVVARNVFEDRQPQRAEFEMADWILTRAEFLATLSLDEMLNANTIFATEISDREISA